MGLENIIPPPTQNSFDRDDELKSQIANKNVNVVAVIKNTAPVYGQRRDWVPRNLLDYGDGGAFPEINVVQYPLEMGEKGKKSTSNALAIQVDETGKVKYDTIARYGHSKDKIIYSKLTDLLPAEVVSEDDPSLQKPSQEEVDETTEKTKLALQRLTNSKISSANPVRCAEKVGPGQLLRYVSSQQGAAFNSGAQDRLIRMVDAQVDPMEPPKHQINRKIPRGPASPPAPVMHSPNRRVTAKEQLEWKIPPCISNWKNPKGYTIPLDKRLAADGRGLQQVHINENFAKLSEALYIADRKARESIETRAQLERKLAQKEKEEKEDHLRQLAQRARDERAGIKDIGGKHEAFENEEERERDMLRKDRHNERARDRNVAPEKRTKLQRERERDISEQIALGVPSRGTSNGETQFDQRLFMQAQGLGQGLANDEAYNVYDKPWRGNTTTANTLYRPSRNVCNDADGEDLDKLIKKNRFVPDKEFSGVNRSGVDRTGPVQFEKEIDPFGLDQFFSQAKKSTNKRSQPEKHEKESNHKRKRHD